MKWKREEEIVFHENKNVPQLNAWKFLNATKNIKLNSLFYGPMKPRLRLSHTRNASTLALSAGRRRRNQKMKKKN